MGQKILARPYYSQRAVFASLSAFFHSTCAIPSVHKIVKFVTVKCENFVRLAGKVGGIVNIGTCRIPECFIKNYR